MSNTTIICNYCHQPAQLVGGEVLYTYRRDLHHLQFWACLRCDAYTGCHKGTTKPMGKLANAELRKARMKAHAAFDPFWRSGNGPKPMTRNGAYTWLARQLGITRGDCHIGYFDVETCRRVVEICEQV